MFCPPIVERELRVALRKLDIRRTRWRTSLIAACISVALLLISLIGGSTFIREVYPWLFIAAIYVAVGKTFSLAGGMFAQERQEQTLGFLFLAGLSMPEIFLTKVLGIFLVAVNNLLALVPFMAIPFLCGGISFDIFWTSVWCLPNLLILALAISTFASACCKEDSAAASLSQVITASLCVVTPGLHWVASSLAVHLPDAWLLVSPAYGPWLIVKQFAFGPPSHFWWNSLITFCWSILFFVLAAAVLRRVWRSEVAAIENRFWKKFIPQWLTRDSKWKQSRAALLEQQPFAWLVTHDRAPERLAWTILAGTAILWLLGWSIIGNAWVSVPNFFVSAALVQLQLTGVVLYAWAKRIAEDRRTGALELLLVTPFSPAEIIQGQREAMHRQFRAIRITTASTWIALALIGLTLRSWSWSALIVYALVWAALIALAIRLTRDSGFAAFYAALITGRSGFAVWKTTTGGNLWNWWWIIYNLQNLFSRVHSFPTGSIIELLIVGIAVPMGFIIAYFYRQNPHHGYTSQNLKGNWIITDFRLIAQSPMPPTSDKRLTKWRANQRFPINEPVDLIS